MQGCWYNRPYLAMNKYILALILLPLIGKSQYHSNNKPHRSLISSLEIGASTYNTKVMEGAVLIGLKDNNEGSTLEIGYVFKHIVDKSVGHSPVYHGLRAAIEMPLLGAFGVYGTYDVLSGKSWIYDDVFGNELKVHSKIHGEGTLGVFFAPEISLLKFYVGLEPRHYDPVKVLQGLTPHQSMSINVKVKYTIDW